MMCKGGRGGAARDRGRDRDRLKTKEARRIRGRARGKATRGPVGTGARGHGDMGEMRQVRPCPRVTLSSG